MGNNIEILKFKEKGDSRSGHQGRNRQHLSEDLRNSIRQRH